MKSTQRHSDSITTPNGNSIIWRYMGLDKFIHLITSKTLYFARLSKLSDKYEGTLPPRSVSYLLNQRREDGRSVDRLKVWKDIKALEQSRDQVYVNCWSLGREESYALWKIYLRGSTGGVAIRTTVGNLARSLNADDNLPFYLAKVEYTQFMTTDDIDPLKLASSKRVYYSYEKEIRAIQLFSDSMLEKQPMLKEPDGWHVDVKTDILIDELYLSPFIGSWFLDSFKDLLRSMAPELVDRIRVSGISDS